MESLFAFVAAAVALGNATAGLAAHESCDTGMPRSVLASVRRCREPNDRVMVIDGSAPTTTGE